MTTATRLAFAWAVVAALAAPGLASGDRLLSAPDADTATLAHPLGIALPGLPDAGPTVVKEGSMSPLAPLATDLGPVPASFPVDVTVGLDLRDHAGLDAFLLSASDPASPDFQRWLTQDEFNARFGPTPEQEAAVVAWLSGAGFTVTQTHANRLLVEASGDAAAAQAAFGVEVHRVVLDGQARHAILQEPSFPAEVAAFTTGVMGLDDLARLKPLDNLGTNCCYLSPRDTDAVYDEQRAVNTGAGQKVVIVGAYDHKDTDLAGFNAQMGLPAVAVTRVCTPGSGSSAGCKFSAQQSIEISMDVEYVHGTAPSAGIVSILSRTTATTAFTSAYNQVVLRNDGHSVSTSWGLCEQLMSAATRASDDNIFANGNALGQSWFAASGDSGSLDCNGATGVDYPASSPYIMASGGTHVTCPAGSFIPSNPVCSGYGSETGWSGSGGGTSVYYAHPAWQTGCGVPAGNRHVPDVSLASDSAPGYLVAFNGGWYAAGGTSIASPQHAGMFAALNAAKGGSGLGHPGLRLYQLCASSGIHDITSGSNGGFSAVAGYDRVTGVGTVDEANLIANW